MATSTANAPLTRPRAGSRFWRGLAATVDNQLKGHYREPSALFFTLALPLLLLLLLSAFNFHVREANGQMRPYVDVLLPGLIALNGLFIGFSSVAFTLARYKEHGVLRRVRVTPLPTGAYVGGVIIAELIVLLVVTAITYGAGVWLFGAHVSGSVGLLFLLAMLGGVVFIALGLLVVSFVRTFDAVPPVFNLILFPSLLFSGALLDRSGLPNWLQWITNGLPMTFLVHAEQQIGNLGHGLSAVRGDLLGLAVWGVAATLVCAWKFRMA